MHQDSFKLQQTKTVFLVLRTETRRWVSWLVNWCFEPSQPQWIISGLKETFITRYLVDGTNKAEREDRKSNRVRKLRIVGRIYGMYYSWKGHTDRNRHRIRSRIKRSEQARLVYVRHKLSHPHHVKGSLWGRNWKVSGWSYLTELRQLAQSHAEPWSHSK